jgi:hypothetical protein
MNDIYAAFVYVTMNKDEYLVMQSNTTYLMLLISFVRASYLVILMKDGHNVNIIDKILHRMNN